MLETWKDIPDFVGYYQVSSHGNVRRLDRCAHHCVVGDYDIPGGYVEPMISGNYLAVWLTTPEYRCERKISKLVAEAFVKNPHSKPLVLYKDGNRANNNYTNLEWATRSELVKHYTKIGIWKNPPAYAGKAVKCCETGETFTSLTQAAEHFKLTPEQVSYSAWMHQPVKDLTFQFIGKQHIC